MKATLLPMSCKSGSAVSPRVSEHGGQAGSRTDAQETNEAGQLQLPGLTVRQKPLVLGRHEVRDERSGLRVEVHRTCVPSQPLSDWPSQTSRFLLAGLGTWWMYSPRAWGVRPLLADEVLPDG